jgi:acyl carrier protein
MPLSERLRSVIAGALRIEQASVREDSTPRSLPAWTSVSQLMLIGDLERAYGVRLTTAEILSIDGVADVMRVLESRGVQP